MSIEGIEAVARLTKDLREASRTMSATEARFMVDMYYVMQEARLASASRVRSMSDEPHAVMNWFEEQFQFLEGQVKATLDKFTQGHPMGEWMRGVYGIGPVISAGLLAHIDIHRAPTVGHIWAFAGLDPSKSWDKGKKRPWNADLKVLCWHAGESFKRFSARPECVYGHVYRRRKEYEVARNDRGDHIDLCIRELRDRGRSMTDEQRAHYEGGKIPPGRVDLRAMRYAVKQFLSDLHAAWHQLEFGRPAPLPYPIAIMGHAHLRPPLHGG